MDNVLWEMYNSGFLDATFKLILFIAAVMGLLECFFGYKIQKIITCILSGVIFGALGYSISSILFLYQSLDFSQSSNQDVAQTLSVVIGLLFAVVGLFLGFKLYKIMTIFIFSSYAFSIGFMLPMIFSGSGSPGAASVIVGLIFAVAVGFVVAKLFKPIIIVVSAILGGSAAGYALHAFFTYESVAEIMSNILAGNFAQQDSSSFMISLVLIVLGVIFQWKTAEKPIFRVAGGPQMSPQGIYPVVDPSGFAGVQQTLPQGVYPVIPQSSMANGAQNNTQNGATCSEKTADNGSLNKILTILSQPVVLPNENKNIVFYFLGGAALALLATIKAYGIIAIFANFSLTALFTCVFLLYNKKLISPLIINSCMLSVLVFHVFQLFILVLNNGNFSGIMATASALVFIYAFWRMLIKNVENSLLFAISGAGGVISFLGILINGSTSFFALSIICVSIPFAMPIANKYITKENLTKAIRLSSDEEKPTQDILQQNQVEVAPSEKPLEDIPLQQCTSCQSPLASDASFCIACGQKANQDELA